MGNDVHECDAHHGEQEWAKPILTEPVGALESCGIDDEVQEARVGSGQRRALRLGQIFKRGVVGCLALPDVLEDVFNGRMRPVDGPRCDDLLLCSDVNSSWHQYAIQ
ncbi:MAG: hypothetical protein JOZ65_07180 [Chloroflexi bacterium]|nr:hypothetical protein [Chloroflexota bacterium]